MIKNVKFGNAVFRQIKQLNGEVSFEPKIVDFDEIKFRGPRIIRDQDLRRLRANLIIALKLVDRACCETEKDRYGSLWIAEGDLLDAQKAMTKYLGKLRHRYGQKEEN